MNTTDNLAGLAGELVSERMVPEDADMFTFWEHVYRYAFASHFVKQMRVLDIACGEGYGAAALQYAGASSVIGVDISESVCERAQKKYGIDAIPGRAEQIPLSDGMIDVIVSFETIEHVRQPDRFLDECVRVLAPNGRLIISTPRKGAFNQKNPYHCSELTEGEFTDALRSRFRECELYTQRPTCAAWWSARTLVCEDTPWKRIRGFSRLRHAIQYLLIHEAVMPPTAKERDSIVALIAAISRSSRHLFNPFALRARRSWNREVPTYFVANAIR